MDELREKFIKRPHVVILGAGATIDSLPNGDKNGNPSAVMNNMIYILGLESLLNKIKLKTQSTNIEDIYSELYDRGAECIIIRNDLENEIRKYFFSLQIPDNVTKYDLILLSLTNKDCVASFNWDPILIQAYNRVRRLTKNLPEILFLHGNVGAGICEQCKQFGPIQNICPKCKNKFESVPLLYPVKQKNYNNSTFIRDSWNVFTCFLNKAAIVTIYGYSAPVTDVEASAILIESFSKYKESHKLDTIEIIEKEGFDKSILSKTWDAFISTTRGHYELYDNFFESLLAKAPRRSVECYFKRNVEGWWGSPTISLSENMSFKDIHKELSPLIIAEIQNNFDVI